MKKPLIIGIFVIVIAIGIFILTQTSNNDSSVVEQLSDAQTATPANADEKMQQMASSDQKIDITMKNFEFSQNKITAKPGETITINLGVESGSHNFVIDELGIQSETLGGSNTGTVTFTVPDSAAGKTYAYYCSIGSHRAQGMEGQLVITQ